MLSKDKHGLDFMRIQVCTQFNPMFKVLYKHRITDDTLCR